MVFCGPPEPPPCLSPQHEHGSQGFGVLQPPGAAQTKPGHILPTGTVSPSDGTVGAGQGSECQDGAGPGFLRGAELDGGSGAGLGTLLLPTGAELAVTEQFNKK